MEKYHFTANNIACAPDENGVYLLYEGEELIYIGRAVGLIVTIRTRLQCHFRGDEGPCTKRATSYSRYVCSDGAQFEAELLAIHKKVHGRLPRCNARIG